MASANNEHTIFKQNILMFCDTIKRESRRSIEKMEKVEAKVINLLMQEMKNDAGGGEGVGVGVGSDKEDTLVSGDGDPVWEEIKCSKDGTTYGAIINNKIVIKNECWKEIEDEENEEGVEVKEEGVEVKEEGVEVKEEGVEVKEEGVEVKEEGVEVKEENKCLSNDWKRWENPFFGNQQMNAEEREEVKEIYEVIIKSADVKKTNAGIKEAEGGYRGVYFKKSEECGAKKEGSDEEDDGREGDSGLQKAAQKSDKKRSKMLSENDEIMRKWNWRNEESTKKLRSETVKEGESEDDVKIYIGTDKEGIEVSYISGSEKWVYKKGGGSGGYEGGGKGGYIKIGCDEDTLKEIEEGYKNWSPAFFSAIKKWNETRRIAGVEANTAGTKWSFFGSGEKTKEVEGGVKVEACGKQLGDIKREMIERAERSSNQGMSVVSKLSKNEIDAYNKITLEKIEEMGKLSKWGIDAISPKKEAVDVEEIEGDDTSGDDTSGDDTSGDEEMNAWAELEKYPFAGKTPDEIASSPVEGETSSLATLRISIYEKDTEIERLRQEHVYEKTREGEEARLKHILSEKDLLLKHFQQEVDR